MTATLVLAFAQWLPEATDGPNVLRDRVGIIAMVSTVLAENGVNILNLDQTILDGFFNMIMTADMAQAKISLKDLQEILRSKGEAIGLEIRAQHADIFQVMHRV